MFGFHDNHGSKIVLSDNQQTAERTGKKGTGHDGIVMSRDPMQVKRLYEVSHRHSIIIIIIIIIIYIRIMMMITTIIIIIIIMTTMMMMTMFMIMMKE